MYQRVVTTNWYNRSGHGRNDSSSSHVKSVDACIKNCVVIPFLAFHEENAMLGLDPNGMPLDDIDEMDLIDQTDEMDDATVTKKPNKTVSWLNVNCLQIISTQN